MGVQVRFFGADICWGEVFWGWQVSGYGGCMALGECFWGLCS
jgi:hypothetical protein